MNTLEQLVAYFERFPGVGARQARRFAFHILTLEQHDANRLTELITAVRATVISCELCQRFFVRAQNETSCDICRDPQRDNTRLMILERDSDVQAMERTGLYNGQYFVLGGTVPLIEQNDATHIRSGALKTRVSMMCEHGLTEIILAFSVNPEGENTERYVRARISDLIENRHITITHLGRGLSTGSELEYADSETLKYAFTNRY